MVIGVNFSTIHKFINTIQVLIRINLNLTAFDATEFQTNIIISI